jgi:O-antigen ligase
MNMQKREKQDLGIKIGFVLAILVLFGYPMIAMTSTISGVPNQLLSYPFRGFVFSLSCFLILFTIINKPSNFLRVNRINPVLLIFFFMYAFRLVYDVVYGDIFGSDKALVFFIASTVVPTIAVTIAGIVDVEDRRWITTILLCSLFVSASSVIASRLGLSSDPLAAYGMESTRLWFEAINPITLGHTAGAGIICSLLILTGRTYSLTWRTLALIGIALGIYVVLRSNSRGPIIAVMMGVTWLLFISERISFGVVIMGFIGILAVSTIGSDLLGNVIDRFSGAAESVRSYDERVRFMRIAWEDFLNRPIFGAYSLIQTDKGGVYPHNVFLDILMSLGLLGVIPFIIMLFKSAAKMLGEYRYAHPLLSALLIQEFFGINFSGSVWGADAFFLLLSLSLSRYAFRPGEGAPYQRPSAAPRPRGHGARIA